jgi:hypothetical protein
MSVAITTAVLLAQSFCFSLDSAKVKTEQICWQGNDSWKRSFLGVDMIHLKNEKKWRIINHSKKEWFELTDSALIEISTRKRVALELFNQKTTLNSNQLPIKESVLKTCPQGMCFSSSATASDLYANIESLNAAKHPKAAELFPLFFIQKEYAISVPKGYKKSGSIWSMNALPKECKVLSK